MKFRTFTGIQTMLDADTMMSDKCFDKEITECYEIEYKRTLLSQRDSPERMMLKLRTATNYKL